MDLPEEIAAVRTGEGSPAALVGEFRRTAVYVPLIEDGLMCGDFGGIRWIYAFTDEAALARFATGLGPAADRLREYFTVPGARLLDVVIPDMGRPAGVAVDVADTGRSMLFPPVRGIVPDVVAVDAEDAEDAEDAVTAGGEAAR